MYDLLAEDGPVVLVGHSYGGAVITEAGTHPNVTALVYIAAFVPDAGESVMSLGGDPSSPDLPIVEAPGGDFFQNRATFHDAFGADLSAADAAFLADSQVPWGANAMAGTVTEPAWRTTPLVSGRHRRPHDPADRPARDGAACPRHHRRGRCQSRGLHVTATCRRGPHRAGLPVVRSLSPSRNPAL